MRKIFFILAIFTASLCSAQTSNLFNKVPGFLVQASKEDLAKVFQSPSFFRFSSTLPAGTAVAYENTIRAKEGSLEEIQNQIKIFRTKLLAAKEETPDVEYFDWADYKERIETYPCGLVAVFHDDRLVEVWLDLK